MKAKNPLLLASSVLGLTIATASFAATTQPTPTAPVMDNGKPQMWQKGWDKKGDHRGMGKGGMMGGKGMQALNLTDAQKSQLEQLRNADKAKMAQFKTQLDQLDKNIATQKAAGASTATLLGLYQQKQAVMNQFFAMHQQQRQQFMNVLTPEQQLKMYESQNRGPGDRPNERRPDERDGMRKPPMPPMPAGTTQR